MNEKKDLQEITIDTIQDLRLRRCRYEATKTLEAFRANAIKEKRILKNELRNKDNKIKRHFKSLINGCQDE